MNGNKATLEEMPVEILGIIIKHFDYDLDDLISLCLSSKIIYAKVIKGDLIKKKSIDIVKYWSPAAQLEYSVIDNATLLNRQFCTTYYFLLGPLINGEPRFETFHAGFGSPSDSAFMTFDLEGLPPKEGTIVPLIADISERDAQDQIEFDVAVYISLDDMYEDIFDKCKYTPNGVLSQFFDCVCIKFERDHSEESEKADSNADICIKGDSDITAFFKQELDKLIENQTYGGDRGFIYAKIRLP